MSAVSCQITSVWGKFIKTRVKVAILYLTLCRPSLAPSKGLSNIAKPLHSCGFLFLGSMDNKSFHGHVHTQTHMQTYYVTRLEARVSHANETDPGCNKQHANVLHSRASLGKLKSFSPPSPVIVTLMERRITIILPPTHCKRIEKESLCVSFSSPWIKEISLKYTISNIVPVISLPAIYWRKSHRQGHWVLFNSDEGRDPSEHQ